MADIPKETLIHYGALRENEAAGPQPVAILVCHGMGQQVRYETISSVGDAILQAAKENGAQVQPVEVNLSANEEQNFLARAELRWIDSGGAPHEVHIYEAYWAPLTEGKVTYWDTAKFLGQGMGNGLRYSLRGSFNRWMFGDSQEMKIGKLTLPAILITALVLLGLIGLSALMPLVGLNLVKQLMANPLTFKSFVTWLHPFLSETGLILAVLMIEAFAVRYFLIEFVGDVAAYVSPYKDSKFDDLRHKIQQVGLDAGKVIYGFEDQGSLVPNYKNVLVVGHSLGSVLAYDTLNALINLDNVSPGKSRHVLARTRGLITFGSPLDKTAFIFRAQMQAGNSMREQLAASMQPLIISYQKYRPDTFRWVNIWSRMDIISGELNYYDNIPDADPRHVQNMQDPAASVPLYAHVQYWKNKTLRDQLYSFVS
jgi:hypothetical protein